jgi:dienelactone hydrolase
MYWLLVIFVVLAFLPAQAETVKIPWKGDYGHNGETIWSPENKYHKSGFTRNFMNGAPEEHLKVQREGFLQAELHMPKLEGPVPFVILMHGCSGLADSTPQRWVSRLKKVLTAQGYGVLVLDSFTTRHVGMTCGAPNYHWGVRRAEDAYSALDYLVESKLAKPDDVFVIGRSNGALAAIMISDSVEVRDHQHTFAGVFALSPVCEGLETIAFATPVVVFIGDKDEAAGDTKICRTLNRSTGAPVHVTEFRGVYHGYEDEDANSVFHGWHMKYDAKAEKYTMATIYELLKSKNFQRGLDYR